MVTVGYTSFYPFPIGHSVNFSVVYQAFTLYRSFITFFVTQDFFSSKNDLCFSALSHMLQFLTHRELCILVRLLVTQLLFLEKRHVAISKSCVVLYNATENCVFHLNSCDTGILHSEKNRVLSVSPVPSQPSLIRVK